MILVQWDKITCHYLLSGHAISLQFERELQYLHRIVILHRIFITKNSKAKLTLSLLTLFLNNVSIRLIRLSAKISSFNFSSFKYYLIQTLSLPITESNIMNRCCNKIFNTTNQTLYRRYYVTAFLN